MTLRTRESESAADLKTFSEKLFAQMKNHPGHFNLTAEGPLFTLLHPALVKIETLFEQGQQLNPPLRTVQGWNFRCFENERSARSEYPATKSFKGFPWIIHQHLLHNSEDILLDFGILGWAFLTRQALENNDSPKTLRDYQLPQWLDYALSPELWGPAGKWTRFHDRLHTLFEKYGLLIAQDYPGFYPLKTDARKLETAGFLGNTSESSYVLTLPWDFSLSALTELENVLLRELSCSS